MKQFARFIVVSLLGWKVRRLQKKHSFKTIAVAGSIGKTSTKFAIAQVLMTKYRVRWQEGNYNDLATVPLVFFGQQTPSLFNPLAWLRVFVRAEAQIHAPYPYDVVVIEVGTDGPGQIAAFKRYLHVDLAVMTAISQEHMQNFTDLDEVAKEELSVGIYSDQLLVNADLVAAEYRSLVPEATTYGQQAGDYHAVNIQFSSDGVSFDVTKDGAKLLNAAHTSISTAQVHSLMAAVAVADLLGLAPDAIVSSLEHVTQVNGRLRLLNGLQNSTIIDDTYNSSPEAAKASLQTLYRINAPQKIALLGNMNELGAFSADAHRLLGEQCDPKQLAEVVTLGPDANEYLAAAAEAKGCKVTRCQTPYEAGEYLKQIIQEEALLLVKGSQNKVFAEEAVKLLLADPKDEQFLVRQSPDWLKIKDHNFKS